ncbi:GSCOCG00010376001-RA-CDS [Cotesia congregata]|nr:GSCOCG00010376001-RA-CDS [Cotesia congregata]
MKSDNKISMRLVQRALFELPLNETPKGIIDKPQRRHLTNDTAEEKDYSEPRDVMETSKKITRPIGVTRPPEELRLRKENFLQVKNENDLSRKKKELEDVVRKLNKDIAIYHSLCKRWKKINEQVIK